MSGLRESVAAACGAIERAVRLAEHEAIKPQHVYEVLADLKLTPLPRLFDVLAAGLARSLAEHDVREDDGGDPADSVRTARLYLHDAATAATAICEDVEAAQAAISRTHAR